MTREEWLTERLSGIGASDAAAVIGASPYKTNTALWEEKTGRRQPEDISDKPYVKYGNDAEALLRALFALDFPQYTVTYDQFGMIRNNPDAPFAFATLDGELNDGWRNGVLEIKTAEIQNASQWAKWDNKVPQNYYIQVIHQLMATGYSFAILKAQIKYTDKNGEKQAAVRHYRIERADVEADIKYLLQMETEFWKCVREGRRPNQILPPL